MFTQREIDFLDEYYQGLLDEFELNDQNLQDYARKVSKASLEADVRYNQMRQGLCEMSDWKEAQAIFDTLSKSANFAACRRKPNENVGLGA